MSAGPAATTSCCSSGSRQAGTCCLSPLLVSRQACSRRCASTWHDATSCSSATRVPVGLCWTGAPAVFESIALASASSQL